MSLFVLMFVYFASEINRDDHRGIFLSIDEKLT